MQEDEGATALDDSMEEAAELLNVTVGDVGTRGGCVQNWVGQRRALLEDGLVGARIEGTSQYSGWLRRLLAGAARPWACTVPPLTSETQTSQQVRPMPPPSGSDDCRGPPLTTLAMPPVCCCDRIRGVCWPQTREGCG